MNNKETTKMAMIGVVNTTTMAISKGVAFAGAILLFAGVGGMALSSKHFTETELNYISEHVTTK